MKQPAAIQPAIQPITDAMRVPSEEYAGVCCAFGYRKLSTIEDINEAQRIFNRNINVYVVLILIIGGAVTCLPFIIATWLFGGISFPTVASADVYIAIELLSVFGLGFIFYKGASGLLAAKKIGNLCFDFDKQSIDNP